MACLMVCSLAISAQKEMQKELKRYLIANGQISSMTTQMTTPLVKATELLQLQVPNGYTKESMVKKYVNERFITDFVSVISPMVAEQGVTAEQISVLADMLETPEGKTATLHSQKLSSDEGMKSMIEKIQPDIIAIVQGKTPQKHTANNVKPERKKLFTDYYKSCGIGSMLPAIIKAQMANANLDETIQKKLETYLTDNMEVLLLMASEGVMTDTDLRFYNRLCAQPQYEKMINGMTSIMNNPQELGISILMKYKTWADNL